MLYAAMARERSRQFAENPGGINLYTGEHWRTQTMHQDLNSLDKNGNKVKLLDGSKFSQVFDVEQQRQVEFIKMWIAFMNDTLSDLGVCKWCNLDYIIIIT